jgi:metal transporter CNNM
MSHNVLFNDYHSQLADYPPPGRYTNVPSLAFVAIIRYPVVTSDLGRLATAGARERKARPMTVVVWIGIALCISQSAMFSGLNLAFFSISKLYLELEAANHNASAQRVLALRKDSNFLLVTILWGNVSVNVLLALLSDSVLAGVVAFLFSTVVITILGEIMPQAYFSRHALLMASKLSPVLRFYQIVLFVVAKPTALVLDRWLGPEAIGFLREKDIRELIKMHINNPETEIDQVEGRGALNFLSIDDLPLAAEGEVIDPKSIIKLEFRGNRPVMPSIKSSSSDTFLKRIYSSGKKWIILTDLEDNPRMVLESDSFLREAIFDEGTFKPYSHCHRPIIIKNGKIRLGETISRLKVYPDHRGDDVVDEDVILLWGEEKRIITGSDILGRLLRGIVQNEGVAFDRSKQIKP